jgi:hypothetical protein
MSSPRQHALLARLRTLLERELMLLDRIMVFWMRSDDWQAAAPYEEHSTRVHDLHARVSNLITKTK